MRGFTFPLIALLVWLCVGCAALPPETTEEEKNEGTAVREELSAFLTIIETNMKVGTPGALKESARQLSRSPAGESERGEELRYIAVTLHKLLYPLLDRPEVPATVPISNKYRLIFENVTEGRITETEGLIAINAIPFFDLVFPAVAVLYTEDDETARIASENLEQAAELEPRSVIPPYLLGVAAYRKGNLEKAEEYFRSAIYPESGCYPAKIGLAEVLLAKDEYANSWEITRTMLDQFPDLKKLHAIAARAQYNRGNLDQALVFVDNVLRMEDNAEMLLLRLNIVRRQEKYDLAKRFLTIVKKQNEPTAELAAIEADILYHTGDSARALAVLENALSAFPEDEQLLLLYDTIRFTTAFTNEEWKRAAELLEKLPRSESSIGLLEKKLTIYRKLNNDEKATEIAERLFEADSSNPEYIAEYARSTIKSPGENGENLIITLEPLIEQGLRSASSRKTRSELYFLQSALYEDSQKRLTLLQNALFENLQNTEALLAITAVYREIGDLPKALRYAKQAALQMPENRSIREEIEELESMLE